MRCEYCVDCVCLCSGLVKRCDTLYRGVVRVVVVLVGGVGGWSAGVTQVIEDTANVTQGIEDTGIDTHGIADTANDTQGIEDTAIVTQGIV